jgi:hypothetical protein
VITQFDGLKLTLRNGQGGKDCDKTAPVLLRVSFWLAALDDEDITHLRFVSPCMVQLSKSPCVLNMRSVRTPGSRVKGQKSARLKSIGEIHPSQQFSF